MRHILRAHWDRDESPEPWYFELEGKLAFQIQIGRTILAAHPQIYSVNFSLTEEPLVMFTEDEELKQPNSRELELDHADYALYSDGYAEENLAWYPEKLFPLDQNEVQAIGMTVSRRAAAVTAGCFFDDGQPECYAVVPEAILEEIADAKV